MKNHASSNVHPFTDPFAAAQRGGHGGTAAAEGNPDPTANRAAGGSTRGRRSGYAPTIIDLLCGSIRNHGLSDSAAARAGVLPTASGDCRRDAEAPNRGAASVA